MLDVENKTINVFVDLLDTDLAEPIVDTKLVLINASDFDSVINLTALKSLITTSLGFTAT